MHKQKKYSNTIYKTLTQRRLLNFFSLKFPIFFYFLEFFLEKTIFIFSSPFFSNSWTTFSEILVLTKTAP